MIWARRKLLAGKGYGGSRLIRQWRVHNVPGYPGVVFNLFLLIDGSRFQQRLMLGAVGMDTYGCGMDPGVRGEIMTAITRAYGQRGVRPPWAKHVAPQETPA